MQAVSAVMSIESSTSQRRPVSDVRLTAGLVDTSVVIDLGHLDKAALPLEMAVSAITMAELAAGPHATDDPAERARRQDRLQRTEATFDPVPFDGAAARAYGRIYAAVLSQGRKARRQRSARACRCSPATRRTSRAWSCWSRSSRFRRRPGEPGIRL